MSAPQRPKKNKPKTRKCLSKRIKITATGKVMMNRPGRRHLAESKSPKRRRQLRRKLVLRGAIAKAYRQATTGV